MVDMVNREREGKQNVGSQERPSIHTERPRHGQTSNHITTLDLCWAGLLSSAFPPYRHVCTTPTMHSRAAFLLSHPLLKGPTQ